MDSSSSRQFISSVFVEAANAICNFSIGFEGVGHWEAEATIFKLSLFATVAK